MAGVWAVNTLNVYVRPSHCTTHSYIRHDLRIALEPDLELRPHAELARVFGP